MPGQSPLAWTPPSPARNARAEHSPASVPLLAPPFRQAAAAQALPNRSPLAATVLQALRPPLSRLESPPVLEPVPSRAMAAAVAERAARPGIAALQASA